MSKLVETIQQYFKIHIIKGGNKSQLISMFTLIKTWGRKQFIQSLLIKQVKMSECKKSQTFWITYFPFSTHFRISVQLAADNDALCSGTMLYIAYIAIYRVHLSIHQCKVLEMFPTIRKRGSFKVKNKQKKKVYYKRKDGCFNFS